MSGQIDHSTAGQEATRKVLKHPAIVIGGVIAAIATLLLVFFGTISWLRELGRREMSRERPLATQTGYALPSLENVERIQVRMDVRPAGLLPGVDDKGDLVDFDVREQYWAGVIAGLTPSERDPEPCTWVGLANVTIDTKDKHSECLNVYALDECVVGAFSTEDGKYYRGGNTRSLRSTLLTAYARALKDGRVKHVLQP